MGILEIIASRQTSPDSLLFERTSKNYFGNQTDTEPQKTPTTPTSIPQKNTKKNIKSDKTQTITQQKKEPLGLRIMRCIDQFNQKKSEELKKIQKRLEFLSKCITHLNSEVTSANFDAQNNKPWKWDDTTLSVMKNIDTKLLHIKFREPITTDPNKASLLLADYSKKLNDTARRSTTQATQIRQTISTSFEISSATIKEMQSIPKHFARNLS